MNTQVEKLPKLIQRAMAALDKATSAAEVMEAVELAGVAYTAAKATARLKQVKEAHETLLKACHKMMGDALLIEARAMIRLADEYDAAQERGEVAANGEIGRNRSSQQKHLSTAADIGIKRTAIHAARKVRDAEQKEPGIIKKKIEAKMEAGEEPTRADMKRAVNESISVEPGGGIQPSRKKDKPRKKRARSTDPVKDKINEKTAAGVSSPKIADELGLPDSRAVRHHQEDERLREEGRQEVWTALLGAADAKNFRDKGKLRIEDAIRIHKARLDREFEQRVNAEVRRRIDTADDAMRASYKKLHLENINLQRIVGERGVFTETQYRQMLILAHPDDSASPELKSELLQILTEKKTRLIRPNGKERTL